MNGGSHKPIDAAWRSYRQHMIPATASEVRQTECQRAFYAGTQWLLAHLMTTLDPGDEPTAADLRRLDEIETELDQFAADAATRRE